MKIFEFDVLMRHEKVIPKTKKWASPENWMRLAYYAGTQGWAVFPLVPFFLNQKRTFREKPIFFKKMKILWYLSLACVIKIIAIKTAVDTSSHDPSVTFAKKSPAKLIG